MKEKSKKHNLIKIWILIGALILATVGTLAWFVVTVGPLRNTFNLSNFDTKVDCYFMNNGSRVEADSYIDSSTGLIILSMYDTDINYVGNFRADIKYKGKGNAYLRSKVVCEFDVAGSPTSSNSQIPFTVNAYDEETAGDQNAWFDNRNNDFCYYYANILEGSNTSYQTLNLITGINTSDSDTGFDIDSIKENDPKMMIAVESDMVQINRYPQIWHIENLPWKV